MSEKLRHFTSTDPPPKSTKQEEREEIEAAIQQYLQSGGQIKVCEIQVREEIKRNRREQIDYIRRRDMAMKDTTR